LHKIRGEYVRRLYVRTLIDKIWFAIPIVFKEIGTLYPNVFGDICGFRKGSRC
jgi:hypothetical protein